MAEQRDKTTFDIFVEDVQELVAQARKQSELICLQNEQIQKCKQEIALLKSENGLLRDQVAQLESVRGLLGTNEVDTTKVNAYIDELLHEMRESLALLESVDVIDSIRNQG